MQIQDCKLETGGLAGGYDFPAGSLLSWCFSALLSLLVFAAVVLAWRRLAGALANPLGPAVLIGAGLATAAAAATVRLGWRGVGGRGWEPLLSRCLPWTVSAAVLAMGAALSLPDTSLLGLAMLWAVLLGEEVWGWAWHVRDYARASPADLADSDEPAPPTKSPTPSGDRAAMAEGFDLEEMPDEDILQQLIRRRAVDGSEALSGWLRVPLAAGQRTANIHVAFCPPFPRTPQVLVDQLDGPGARIKKVQVLPYGVRLDLKLAELSDAPTAVVLQFSALSGPPVQSAVQSGEPEVGPMD